MGDLERDSQLSGDAGQFTAQLSRDWEIWGPNGGYLASIALRAAGRVALIPRPVSLHAHYLRVARFDAVDVRATVLHAGRQAESISVSIEQQGKLVLSALVRTAASAEALVHDAAIPPDVRGPDAATDSRSLRRPESAERHAFWRNFERRVLQPASWERPWRQQSPRWLEWYRYRSPVRTDDAFLQAARSLVLIDTLCWPAAWMHHGDERYLAPSLDLTVWFHRPTSSEWLLADAQSPISHAGVVGGWCQVWSEQRELVASGGSQMLCVPRPPAR